MTRSPGESSQRKDWRFPDPSGALAAASAPDSACHRPPGYRKRPRPHETPLRFRWPHQRAVSPFSLLPLPARSAAEHRPTKTRSVSRPEAVPPRAGCPSTLHQAQHTPGPAGQPAGAAVAPPSEPTASSHLRASRLKPHRGEDCPRRRAPDAARARHFRPSGRRGR